MTKWDLASKDIECFNKFEDVPTKYHTVIRPQMFPPSVEDAPKYNLEKCIRILPHLQNTGAFFVASIQKKSYLPWEKAAKKGDVKNSDEQNANETQESENGEKTTFTGPQQKKRRLHYGYKEDPYIFLTADDILIESVCRSIRLIEKSVAKSKVRHVRQIHVQFPVPVQFEQQLRFVGIERAMEFL